MHTSHGAHFTSKRSIQLSTWCTPRVNSTTCTLCCWGKTKRGPVSWDPAFAIFGESDRRILKQCITAVVLHNISQYLFFMCRYFSFIYSPFSLWIGPETVSFSPLACPLPLLPPPGAYGALCDLVLMSMFSGMRKVRWLLVRWRAISGENNRHYVDGGSWTTVYMMYGFLSRVLVYLLLLLLVQGSDAFTGLCIFRIYVYSCILYVVDWTPLFIHPFVLTNGTI